MYKCADQPVHWYRCCQVFLAVDILKGVINSLSLHGWQRHDISMAVSLCTYVCICMVYASGISQPISPRRMTCAEFESPSRDLLLILY